MMKRFWARIIDVADDILAYVLTVVGILVSNYLPVLKTTGHIDVSLDWWRIAIASLVALMIVAQQEHVDPTVPGAKAGKRSNFGKRMGNALAHGIAWNQVMQMGS